MQSLSKIPILTTSNFKDFKKGDLFKRKNSKMTYVFIKYFENDCCVTIKSYCLEHIIENIKYKEEYNEDFLKPSN